MKLPVYQVDAFASRVFAGNPAIVCRLDRDEVRLAGRCALYMEGVIHI